MYHFDMEMLDDPDRGFINQKHTLHSYFVLGWSSCRAPPLGYVASLAQRGEDCYRWSLHMMTLFNSVHGSPAWTPNQQKGGSLVFCTQRSFCSVRAVVVLSRGESRREQDVYVTSTDGFREANFTKSFFWIAGDKNLPLAVLLRQTRIF